MSRPSNNTNKALLQAGRKLLPKYGVSGLTLRLVATKAKVNLGMFNYYFKNKNDFVEQMLQEIYEDFFLKLKMDIAEDKTPLTNLTDVLFVLGQWIRDNRELVFSLMKDVLNGDKTVIRYVQKNFHRHLFMINDLINDAKKCHEIRDTHNYNIIPPLMASTAVIPILAEVFRRQLGFSILPIPGKLASDILSDKSIKERIDCLIQGFHH